MVVTERERTGRNGLTRRQILLGAGSVGALAIAGVGVAELLGGPGRPRRIPSFAVDPQGRVAAFHSRPELRPPTVATVTGGPSASRGGADPGFLFLGPGPVSLKASEPYGPMIIDRHGELVWFRPLAAGRQVTNFSTANYRGEPVLAWWEGTVLQSGYGRGEAVLVDRSYREIARVRAAGGRWMDMHALLLTPAGTALFTCHPRLVQADLSSIGGSSYTNVFEAIIQEVDIATGRLVMEWRSLEHIPLDESEEPLSEPYDYLHPNSIHQLPDGNLLVSARHTWAVYKLDRRTGNVIWRLGGKRSDFQIDPSARFAWQHDARQRGERELTVFDNGSNGPILTEHVSRGLVLGLDESRKTVKLRAAYPSPQRLSAGAMGSVQILPSGRVVVGWGTKSHTSEFAADGALLVDHALPAGMYSYRGLWLRWSASPEQGPAVAGRRERQSGRNLLFASWNGATGVASWLVHAGSSHDRMRPLGIAKRRGFETAIPLHQDVRFASATALDRRGRPLRRGPVLEL